MLQSEKLTAKQYLKLHPEKYVLVSYEFGGIPIYVAPLCNGEISLTGEQDKAEKWSALDVTTAKVQYHRAATGYSQLNFEVVK
jgi:hypothetical protein